MSPSLSSFVALIFLVSAVVYATAALVVKNRPMRWPEALEWFVKPLLEGGRSPRQITLDVLLSKPAFALYAVMSAAVVLELVSPFHYKRTFGGENGWVFFLGAAIGTMAGVILIQKEEGFLRWTGRALLLFSFIGPLALSTVPGQKLKSVYETSMSEDIDAAYVPKGTEVVHVGGDYYYTIVIPPGMTSVVTLWDQSKCVLVSFNGDEPQMLCPSGGAGPKNWPSEVKDKRVYTSLSPPGKIAYMKYKAIPGEEVKLLVANHRITTM